MQGRLTAQWRTPPNKLAAAFPHCVLVRTTAENYAGLTAAVSSLGIALKYSSLADNLASHHARSLTALKGEIQRHAAFGGM